MADSQVHQFNWGEFGRRSWVVLACIFFFPPLGLFLLWKHPVLGKQRSWWVGACVWGLIWVFKLGSDDSRPDSATAPGRYSATTTQTTAESDATGNEISATDLMTLRNAAAIRKRLTGRFVVTGRVIDVDEEASGFGRRNYKVRLVGTLNNAGLANTWVECLMTKDGGLDKVGPGHYVEVEGEYDRTLGDVVQVKNCCLSKKYHIY